MIARQPLQPILAPGRNCWTDNAPVDSCGILVDGRAYYSAFYQAASKAQRYVLIAGWKFNSHVRLIRGEDAAKNGGDVFFLPFLKKLCERNPDLHVYVLAWNYSPIYSLEWEWFLASKFTKAHPRIHFCFDKDHAIGGSHHQKFVVVDGHVAFVGGLDFNSDDWDDRAHHPENAHRADTNHEGHGPYHDAMVYLTGPAAAELTTYFSERWQRAGNGLLELPPPIVSARVTGQLPIDASRVALSINKPATRNDPTSVMQVRELYADAIAAAKKFIYMENQYFTSSAVADALIARMRAGRTPIDIALVLPKHHHGMMESAAMEPERLRLLAALRSVADETGHRLGVYYSATINRHGEEVPTLIHSKLLVIDDRFLTVGSTNTSNRSMGLDTELNVSWEALTPEDDALAQSIRNARINLLSEHCGFNHCDHCKDLEDSSARVESLDRLITEGTCKLRRLTRETILEDHGWIAPLERWGFYIDPDRPVVDELLIKMQRS